MDVKLHRLIFFLLLAGLGNISAQTNHPSVDKNLPAGSLAALELEMTNAYSRVLGIVNKPVLAYRRGPHMSVSTYPEGWFHPGALKPDFNTVDIRQTQELPYAQHQYVTSDLNPGLVFLGRDLEFNSMTKWFYTNRSIPKHKLSEAEMLEVNQLYRTIGRCQTEIARLQPRTPLEAAPAANGETADAIEPGQPLAGLRSIPQTTRRLYGGIGIGVLLLGVVLARLLKRRSN